MNLNPFYSASLVFLGLLAGCSAEALPDGSDSATSRVEASPSLPYKGCGKPLLEAAQHFPLSVDVAAPKEAFAAVSKANLKRLVEKVGTLSAEEAKLFATAKKMMPPESTHRTHFANLRTVLQGGALKSPRIMQETDPTVKPAVTPPAEEALYGAFACVFTAIGPIAGRPQYGDVVLRFKAGASASAEFGTISSGFTFMRSRRERQCVSQCECEFEGPETSGPWCVSYKQEVASRKENYFPQGVSFVPTYDACKSSCGSSVGTSMAAFKPGLDERQGYARTVVAPDDYEEWFEYTLIEKLRDRTDRGDIVKSLTAIADAQVPQRHRAEWWTIVDSKWLGYLEGKVDGALPLENLESIEVPAEKVAEVQSWSLPESLAKRVKAIEAIPLADGEKKNP